MESSETNSDSEKGIFGEGQWILVVAVAVGLLSVVILATAIANLFIRSRRSVDKSGAASRAIGECGRRHIAEPVGLGVEAAPRLCEHDVAPRRGGCGRAPGVPTRQDGACDHVAATPRCGGGRPPEDPLPRAPLAPHPPAVDRGAVLYPATSPDGHIGFSFFFPAPPLRAAEAPRDSHGGYAPVPQTPRGEVHGIRRPAMLQTPRHQAQPDGVWGPAVGAGGGASAASSAVSARARELDEVVDPIQCRPGGACTAWTPSAPPTPPHLDGESHGSAASHASSPVPVLDFARLRSNGGNFLGVPPVPPRPPPATDTVLSHVTAVGVSPRVGVPRAERE